MLDGQNATKRAVIDDQTGGGLRPSGRVNATKRAAYAWGVIEWRYQA